MTRRRFQFPKLHTANSAGLEPKMPGGFCSRFAFGRMDVLTGVFFNGFEENESRRTTGVCRGTGVAKQDTP
jgi:hypothetical protein